MPGIGEIFVLLLIFLIGILPVILTYKKAGKKNRSKAGWLIISLFFGWIAFIVIIFLPENSIDEED